jgi:hypothetical protein
MMRLAMDQLPERLPMYPRSLQHPLQHRLRPAEPMMWLAVEQLPAEPMM